MTDAPAGSDGGVDVDALGALAVHLATEAGAVLQRFRSAIDGGKVLDVQTKGSLTDPVTAADTASEQRLVDLLRQHRPDDGLLGEEGSDTPGTTGLRWVVDPLDGTVNYLYGLPAWTVSVAVEQQTADGWETLAGAVHHPPSGETFRAVRGAGAWLGPRRLAVNDPVEVPMALVATGFAYDAGRRAVQAAMIADLLPQVRDIRRIGSAALDLCRVAVGRVDAYVEDPLRRWDMAAGALIAREAGAIVTVSPGADEGAFGIVAAGPALHPELTALLSG
ncbi:inositol monophosphatase family protein [soil metagenome]